MGVTNLIDISSYQGLNFDLGILKNQYGINKVAMKFTEGGTYVNPYARAQYNGTVSVGSIPCPYHYTKAANYAQASEEAQYFISVLRQYNVTPATPIMLDLEDPTYIPQNTATITAVSNGFYDTLVNAGYTNLILYMSADWVGRFYDTTNNKFTKLWVAQYLNGPYYNQTDPDLSYRPYGCDIWQFSSTWGYKFPNGYWGGAGLDVNHDYNDTISYLNTASKEQEPVTTTTIKPKEEVEMQELISSEVDGVITFFKDTTVNGVTYKKGSAWKALLTKDGGYNIGPVVVYPRKGVDFYFQPSPYNRNRIESAKGTVVRVHGDKPVVLYKKPTKDLDTNITYKDGQRWSIDKSIDYLVGGVQDLDGTVWLQLATNGWAPVNKFDFVA